MLPTQRQESEKRLSRPWGLCVTRTGATFTSVPSRKVTLNGLMSPRTLSDPWPGARMALSGWHTAPQSQHSSPKAAVERLHVTGLKLSFILLGGEWGWWHFGLLGCGASEWPGLRFNVITQWNCRHREEMCSTWVCLCVCACVGGEWITLASPTLGRRTLLVLSVRATKKELLSKMGSMNLWCFLVDCDLHTFLFVCVCREQLYYDQRTQTNAV